jgi:hypothetical protein
VAAVTAADLDLNNLIPDQVEAVKSILVSEATNGAAGLVGSCGCGGAAA